MDIKFNIKANTILETTINNGVIELHIIEFQTVKIHNCLIIVGKSKNKNYKNVNIRQDKHYKKLGDQV